MSSTPFGNRASTVELRAVASVIAVRTRGRLSLPSSFFRALRLSGTKLSGSSSARFAQRSISCTRVRWESSRTRRSSLQKGGDEESDSTSLSYQKNTTNSFRLAAKNRQHMDKALRSETEVASLWLAAVHHHAIVSPIICLAGRCAATPP